uniref:Membrane-bound transcription factor site-2 protease n=1 Tax=Ditylenchus dipsaci TaxID=166011 RepID=A0A915EES2_9BILA
MCSEIEDILRRYLAQHYSCFDWSAHSVVGPTCLLPFYGTGAGVLVSDVNSKSGLSGATGLQPGHIVTRINQCPVHNASEWTKCLEDLHEKQKTIASAAPHSNSPLGYLVQYSKVLPWTASPDKVSNAASNGEIQCCSEFENVTLSSHICFRYKTAVGEQELRPVEDSPNMEKGNEATTSTLPPPTTPAVNLAESLGVLKNRVKRANLKMKSLPSQPSHQILPSNPANQFSPTKTKSNGSGQSPIQEHDTPSSKQSQEVYSHACLPARQVTDHASCELLDHSGDLKTMPADYVCVVPALYNGTVLLRFELKNKTRPVLFIGFLSEPLYMIDLLDLTPRSDWFPFFIPQAVELFGKYLVTFSLAMGLLNAVPCYGLDGQFMCSTVVDYFAGGRSLNQRLKLTNSIVAFGTTIFTLNVAIGFSKFLYNYWK